MTQAQVSSTPIQQKAPKDYSKIIRNFLNSRFCMLAIISVVLLGWILDLQLVSSAILVVFEIFIFIFCYDNPKAFITPLLAFLCTMRHYPSNNEIIFYIVILSVLLISFATFLVCKIKNSKVKCKKGKMFWAFVPFIIANFLGGVWGYFNIFGSLATLGAILLLYVVYWFCLNFITHAQKHFAYSIIFISILLSLEIFVNYLVLGDFFWALNNKIAEFGTININYASLIILMGVVSCFYLAQNNKRDYLYIILAFILDLIIFQNYSRIATFLAFIVSVVYFIIVVKKSVNRKNIIMGSIITFALILFLAGIFWEQAYALIDQYLNARFSLNGREELWDWCFKSFLKSPLFGIGYVTTDPYVLGGGAPGIGVQGDFSFVHPHNFFLHRLTCIGIIGFILTLPFAIQKYKLIIKKFTTFKLFLILLFITMFASSMFDPTYSSDIFTNIFCISLLAMAENITENGESDEIEADYEKMQEKFKHRTNFKLSKAK